MYILHTLFSRGHHSDRITRWYFLQIISWKHHELRVVYRGRVSKQQLAAWGHITGGTGEGPYEMQNNAILWDNVRVPPPLWSLFPFFFICHRLHLSRSFPLSAIGPAHRNSTALSTGFINKQSPCPAPLGSTRSRRLTLCSRETSHIHCNLKTDIYIW